MADRRTQDAIRALYQQQQQQQQEAEVGTEEESSEALLVQWKNVLLSLLALAIGYYVLVMRHPHRHESANNTHNGRQQHQQQQQEARRKREQVLLARLEAEKTEKNKQPPQPRDQHHTHTTTKAEAKPKKITDAKDKDKKKKESTPTKIPTATTQESTKTNITDNSSMATTSSNNNSKKPNRNKKPLCQTPVAILTKALSDVTGITVLSQKDSPTSKGKDTTKSTTETIVLNDLYPMGEASTWDELHQIFPSLLESSLKSQLVYSKQTQQQKQQQHPSYAPSMIRMNQRNLWKASTWYHAAKQQWRKDVSPRWVDDEGKRQVQPCLDMMAEWIVRMVATQLQSDILAHHDFFLWKQTESTTSHDGDGDGDNDDDFDLGLFADENYGNNSNDDDQQPNPPSNAKTKKKLPQCLLDDFLTILESDSAPKILTKPFVSEIAKTYDLQHNNTDSNTPFGMIVLQYCLQQLPSSNVNKEPLVATDVAKPLNAIANLVTSSPDAVQALVEVTATPTSVPPPMDHDVVPGDRLLGPLLCLGAHTVPRFNFNDASTSAAATTDAANSRRRRQPADDLLPVSFHRAMVETLKEEYPVALYSRRGYDAALKSYTTALDNQRSFMKHARMTAAMTLKKLAATSSSKKGMRKGGALFDWIRHIVEANEPVVDILQSDLLSQESAFGSCSSQPFLLGLVGSILHLCGPNLATRLQSEGAGAFDARYLLRNMETGPAEERVGILISSKERFLAEHDDTKRGAVGSSPRYAGATEFFFLTAALLRVSLFPGLRIQEELHQTYRDIVAAIQTMAQKQLTAEQLKTIPGYTMDLYQKTASTMLGWRAFEEDPEVNPAITSFSLLQLQWLTMVVSQKGEGTKVTLSLIPEWFVKLPAQWIAHVAAFTSRFLQPHQGEAAVQYATQLLTAGTSNALGTFFRLSPPVLTSLIRIAGAFVNAGVNRARRLEANKRATLKKGPRRTSRAAGTDEEDDDFELDIIDDRKLDIYSSFDKRDLGVTVFTNELVSTYLGPTLIRTYCALDAMEGMDVEREHHADKFHVKSDVADLLLRLWAHPNGDARRSLVRNFDPQAFSSFALSAAGSFGMMLDNACQNILDIQDIHKAHEQRFGRMQVQPPLSGRDVSICERHSRAAGSGLKESRRLLMLLCQFSSEDCIASIFGGSKKVKGVARGSKSAASCLAAMFIHTFDRLTNEDGSLHSELDTRKQFSKTRSADILAEKEEMGSSENMRAYLKGLIYARRLVLLEYGLDTSLFTHQMLALAARWHLAAASTSETAGERSSAFLEEVAKNDLCNIKQLRNVVSRLIGKPREMSGSELDNAAYILERDGHVDISIWKDLYKIPGTGPDKSRLKRITAKQERMEHEEIDSIASLQDINTFLDDLGRAVQRNEAARMSVAARWGDVTMSDLEASLLSKSCVLAESDYNDYLDEWVVSSEPFVSKVDGKTFMHSFDALARSQGSVGIGSGRTLVREAKTCKRVLPSPHPNASIYVCFAEERMDLCRAIIIGMVDTPYSLGMFEFDVFFPSTYPSSPPLVTFKTTGDGQTRVSPNLYNDGKVCISVLGTANAWNDSQRWNPKSSSLAQVLASIQAQILGVPDPFFSEGFGHEGVRDTAAGEAGSVRYNNKLRLHTLRRAVIAPLKNPPLGFEEVTKRHYAVCRHRVLAQAKRWALEAQGTPLFRRFTQSYEELATLLSSDDLIHLRIPGKKVKDEKPLGSITPNETDLEALKSLDTSFYQRMSRFVVMSQSNNMSSGDDNDNNNRSPSEWVFPMEASSSTDANSEGGNEGNGEVLPGPVVGMIGEMVDAPVYNPWANGEQVNRDMPPYHQGGNAEDDDDEDLYS